MLWAGASEEPLRDSIFKFIRVNAVSAFALEVGRRAHAAGMVVRGTWVAALRGRANPQSGSVLTDEEVIALRAAFRQLAHVGGNL